VQCNAYLRNWLATRSCLRRQLQIFLRCCQCVSAAWMAHHQQLRRGQRARILERRVCLPYGLDWRRRTTVSTWLLKVTSRSILAYLPQSARPHQFHDRVHDRKRQAVRIRDQLTECLVLPTMFRPATTRHVVTTLGANIYGNRAAGAIPAASVLHLGRTRRDVPG
jgi:hypothetical protein